MEYISEKRDSKGIICILLVINMNKLTKYAHHFTKLELMKARLEVFQNESGREGVDFIIKTEGEKLT